jgi:hypothetical protein
MTTAHEPAADPATTTPDAVTYSYKPSLIGAPFEARLAPEALTWQAGGRSGRIPYGDVRRLRLSFRPVTMQSQRFLTEIWPAQGPKIVIASASWKSMIEQERRDAAYAAFVAELHRRLAAARSTARFEAGSPPLLYWPALALFAAVSLSLAALVVRALQVAAYGGAAFIAAFLGLFLWQAGTFFRRNRPAVYAPDNPPRELIPTV